MSLLIPSFMLVKNIKLYFNTKKPKNSLKEFSDGQNQEYV